jgi:hypothetical protein
VKFDLLYSKVLKEAIGVKDQWIGKWPIVYVKVDQFYSPELEEGADEASIKKYIQQIKNSKSNQLPLYEPIKVSYGYSKEDPLDGSHRVIAAHRLGKEYILAFFDPKYLKQAEGDIIKTDYKV